MPPISVLAVLPGFAVSTIMDVLNPMLDLQRGGRLSFRTHLEFFPNYNKKADIVVFCRNTDPRNIHHLIHVLQQGIPYIYDLDDNLFEIPLDTEVGRYHRAEPQCSTLIQYLENASLVRVYAPRVRELVMRYNPSVELVTPPLAWSHILPPKPNGERVRIVYVTSRREDPLVPVFQQALIRILNKYPSQVEFIFWGNKFEGFENLPNVNFWPFERSYNQFLQKFSSAGFQIGLAPMLEGPFYSSKTNNKFREYGASQIAGIYSDVELYSACVEQGKTGLLVKNCEEDWFEAMEILINRVGLRNAIAQKAYENVRHQYSEQAFQETWFTHIQYALQKSFPNNGQMLMKPLLIPEGKGPFFNDAHFSVEEFINKSKNMLFNLFQLYKINYLKRY